MTVTRIPRRQISQIGELDKTPTLGEITGVLNQYYMNLQPK